ncbi:MAG: RNA polymerase sigma-70 factor [Bacteroidetes bacterium]|nr:RNA polymerase sigma-70 factor [Bacteroidota bacterium]
MLSKKNITILKLKNGDVNSFDYLFRKYNKRIYSFSLSYLKKKEEAEDIVQQVFLTLWQSRKNLKEQHDIQSYLYTVTFNAIKKRFRKLTREKNHLENYFQLIDKDGSLPDTEAEYNNLIKLLEKLIDLLPSRQKEVFVLNKKEDLTIEEISEKLKISKRTVENHLFRAKAFLKKSLIDQGLLSILFYWLFIK